MEPQQFSPQQSLELIQNMISKTKADISGNRFYFLLWGWIALIGILGQYILKVIIVYEHHYAIWLITFVGTVVSIIYTVKRDARQKARTYVADNMSYLWTGLGVGFFVLIIIFTKIGWQYAYPFFILFYGMGTFISGKILQFPPLIIGGIFNWALSAASVFFHFDHQMLFAAAAIITSYLIPGYLLKSKTNG